MDDLTAAILSAARHDANAVQALAYTDQVKQSPDGWKLCLSRLTSEVPDPVVRFFYLLVLQFIVSNRFSIAIFK